MFGVSELDTEKDHVSITIKNNTGLLGFFEAYHIISAIMRMFTLQRQSRELKCWVFLWLDSWVFKQNTNQHLGPPSACYSCTRQIATASMPCTKSWQKAVIFKHAWVCCIWRAKNSSFPSHKLQLHFYPLKLAVTL